MKGGLAVTAEGEVALRADPHRRVAINHSWALTFEPKSQGRIEASILISSFMVE